MSRGLLCLAVCVVVLGLGGCGGGSDSASTTASTAQSTTSATPQPSQQSATATPQQKSKDKGKPSSSTTKEGNKDNSTSSKHLKLTKVPPISSAPSAGSRRPAPGVKTVPGGDNSVQEYGVEADESARTQAAIALQGYLNARAEGDWAAACSLLAQRPKEQLEKLAGQSKSGCAGVMQATGKGTSSQPGSAITEVLSFRGEGDIPGNPSYLIFTAPPGNTLFSMPMYLQGGAWKVGLAQPSELPV